MERFFGSNPGLRSRVGLHVDFPDYSQEELLAIGELMLANRGYRFNARAKEAFGQYLERRRTQDDFANARSVRNALDRARLRQANRLVARGGTVTREDLATIAAEDILASRLFGSAPAEPGREGKVTLPK
jgi:hypothetical protein